MATDAHITGRFAHYALNEAGRDFVVGDVHGCLDDLLSAMREAAFDPKHDRLFSSGDLVNRGPKSFEILEMVEREPWFHPTCGNHDAVVAMIGQSIIGRLLDSGTLELSDRDLREIDTMSAEWIVDLLADIQAGNRSPRDLVTMASPASWPLAIEIETREGPVGVLHGDPCAPHWVGVREALEQNEPRRESVHKILWGDGVAFEAKKLAGQSDVGDKPLLSDISCPGVTRLYSGHVPVKNPPMTVGNRSWIDSGAIWGVGRIELHEVSLPLTLNMRSMLSSPAP